MPVMRFGEGDLLEYNAIHKLLICRQCQYAIQKNALESHLLRHKIYRGDRQRLLSSIAQLDLLDPQHVILPPPGSVAIDGLPIISGFCCVAPDCRHLAATSKRMRRHWTEVHGLDGSVTLSPSFIRPASLQTFFRGTQVRYFEVSSSNSTAPLSDTDNARDSNGPCTVCEEEEPLSTQESTAVSTPQEFPGSAGITPAAIATGFSLETLTYFHHFTTKTSLSLPIPGNPHSKEHYWQVYVMSHALQRRWLMFGLLAISALHSAVLADDTMAIQVHHQWAISYSSQFLEGLGVESGSAMYLEAENGAGEYRRIGEQCRCLLQCIQWGSGRPAALLETTALSRLLSIISTMQGCVLPVSTIGSGSLENGWSQEVSHQDSSTSTSISVLTERLRMLPFRIAERLDRPDNAQDVFAILSATNIMVQCCATSLAHEDTNAVCQAVLTWLTDVSDHFRHMILCDHPAALVLLAHWAAILVKRAENVGCWFWQGLARDMILQVIRQLSSTGQAVIDVVEDVVGIMTD